MCIAVRSQVDERMILNHVQTPDTYLQFKIFTAYLHLLSLKKQLFDFCRPDNTSLFPAVKPLCVPIIRNFLEQKLTMDMIRDFQIALCIFLHLYQFRNMLRHTSLLRRLLVVKVYYTLCLFLTVNFKMLIEIQFKSLDRLQMCCSERIVEMSKGLKIAW